ncbi:hypothetical protein ILYODFUR_014429 [Ilyodon furcidens]|uniref:Uncharacterized protein n=1 Tax=Ilyodon furcidens TaxID=33524 RepID=A0ABV0T9R1_9TELE
MNAFASILCIFCKLKETYTLRKLTKYNFQVSPEFLISVSAAQKPPEQRPPFRSHSPGRPPIQTVYQPVHIPVYIQAKPTWHPQQGQSSGFSRPPFFPGQKPRE